MKLAKLKFAIGTRVARNPKHFPKKHPALKLRGTVVDVNHNADPDENRYFVHWDTDTAVDGSGPYSYIAIELIRVKGDERYYKAESES
jgi:hypothetical protein